MEKQCTWDNGSLWLKDRPCKKYVGQWPIFHGPLILPYIIVRLKLYLYIKKWHRPGVFVPLWALALVILAGNEDMHKILDEFKFRPDRTTDYRVSCPWASKKFPIDLLWENAVSMLACSFLIKSSSKLLVTRTGIKARTSLILGWIRLLTLKLLALEWWKFYTFKIEYLWGQLANLDQILCVASLGVGKGCIMFWGRLDQNSGVHGNRKPHWLIMGKMVSPPFLGCFWSDPFYSCR